jgi:hypothetical protein
VNGYWATNEVRENFKNSQNQMKMKT